MKPYEPTLEDLEEYSKSLELDEMYEREQALELLREQEEAEFRRRECPHEGMGHPAQEPEFDGPEEDENLPD
jgi:hypothetical protein